MQVMHLPPRSPRVRTKCAGIGPVSTATEAAFRDKMYRGTTAGVVASTHRSAYEVQQAEHSSDGIAPCLADADIEPRLPYHLSPVGKPQRDASSCVRTMMTFCAVRAMMTFCAILMCHACADARQDQHARSGGAHGSVHKR
eukprot:2603513-Rhodomonas_salina.2